MSDKLGEGAVQGAILQYLAARRIFAVRMNSGMQLGRYKGKKWAIHMNLPGTADILAFPHYTCRMEGERLGEDWATVTRIIPTWLEVKSATGKQSEYQRSFQEQVEREGHRYAICRSIEDVAEALK